MGRTHGHDDELISLDDLPSIGLPKKTELDDLHRAIDKRLTFACQLKATAPDPDAVLNISAVDIQLADGRVQRPSPSKSQIPDCAGGTLNLLTGAITGDINAFTFPTASALSEYVSMGIALDTLGKLNIYFNIPSLVSGGEGVVPFPSTMLAIGVVELESVEAATTKWKGDGAASNVIENNDITQFLGAGGGGGAGDANSLLADYKVALANSIYDLLSYVIFDIDDDDKIDAATTAVRNYSSSPVTFKFATGDNFTTYDLLDAEFVAGGAELKQVDVQLTWALAQLDVAATYEITRDGGTTWESLSLTRYGNSDTYFGTHVFDVDVIVTALQVRVTASQNDVELQGVGVSYDPQPASSGSEPLNYEKFVISTATNVTEFTLGSFIPNEELLECHVLETGQVFKADNSNLGIMSVEGMKVKFPDEHFYDLPAYDLTIVFSQNTGQTIDFNENNGAMISENHLGSESPSLDRSITGRGIKIRNAAGLLRELTLDENDNIVINSLP